MRSWNYLKKLIDIFDMTVYFHNDASGMDYHHIHSTAFELDIEDMGVQIQ